MLFVISISAWFSMCLVKSGKKTFFFAVTDHESFFGVL